MSKIGIIANPASGKDIRRLVSHATIISNIEKADIIKRIIVGIDSVGVDEILVMPDSYGFGMRAKEALNHHGLAARIVVLDFPMEGTQEDSIQAAKMMREEKVACIITLGGDGTNRVVSKGCGEVPLIPISTGTNNVFPVMTEGTTAGIAAGVLARKLVDVRKVTATQKKLQLMAHGVKVDIALIDSVVVTESFIGARALWNPEKVKQIFLTRAEPGDIGFSSIGAVLQPVRRQDRFGLLIEIGPGGERVRAPIAPGLIKDLDIKTWRVLEPEEKIPLTFSPSIIALDGEREVEIYSSAKLELMLGLDGPIVVNITETLSQAIAKGLFRGGL